MGMSIEEIIKYLPAPICCDTILGKEKQKEYDAHDSAVIILRKYQKIEEILDQLIDSKIHTYDAVTEIEDIVFRQEGVDNGNDD